jgi:adenine phosphoribosyltransferase
MVKLIEDFGGEVVKMVYLIELTFLPGRDKLAGYDVEALIKY